MIKLRLLEPEEGTLRHAWIVRTKLFFKQMESCLQYNNHLTKKKKKR